VCSCVHMEMWVCRDMFVNVYVYMYVCMGIYMYICVCVYMYVLCAGGIVVHMGSRAPSSSSSSFSDSFNGGSNLSSVVCCWYSPLYLLYSLPFLLSRKDYFVLKHRLFFVRT